MTRESLAALPEIIGKSKAAPGMNQVSTLAPGAPPSAAQGFTPQVSNVQGGEPAAAPSMEKKPGTTPMPEPVLDKGAFPIKIIASIQAIYANEQQKQERLQGSMAQGMGLKPGWGGAG